MGWTIHHPKGLLYHDPAKAFPGYTIISMSNGKDAFLIDMEGRVCHRWHRDEGISYGFLLDNGNLLCRTHSSGGFLPPPGTPTGILELDWDSNLVWSYSDPLVHHDFVRLPDGHTLTVLYDLMPQDAARRVRGGHGSVEEPMYGELVREVDAAGATVREWSMWEPLDPEQDAICPMEGRHQWLHQNALNLTLDGDLLVSFRQTDTVGIVSRRPDGSRGNGGRGRYHTSTTRRSCPTDVSCCSTTGRTAAGLPTPASSRSTRRAGASPGSTRALRPSRSTATTSAGRSGSRTATRSSARVRRGGCSR